MEEFNKINNPSESKKINQSTLQVEKTKNELISILIHSFYINSEKSKKLNSLNDVANYMKALIKDDIMSEDTYMQICIQAGAIKLGQYLVYKNFITKEELNTILEEQKKSEKFKNMHLGEILIEKKVIDYEKLTKALEEFGVIRLGEYLIGKGIINELQLNMFIKIQKYKHIQLGKILVEYNVLNQKELNDILETLSIQLTNYDFSTKEDEELDYYRLKE